MGMGFGLSGAAAGAAVGLEDLLKQKFLEQIQQQKLAEDVRQANMQNAVQTRQLGQGDQRIGLDRDALTQRGEQFGVEAGFKDRGLKLDEVAQPVRLKQMTAQTDDILRKPIAEREQREFTTGRDKALHGYQLGEIGAQGANALRIANVRHPEAAGPATTPREANEIQDSLSLIDEIRNDPALKASVGPIEGRGAGYVTAGPEAFTRVKAHHDNLVNKMQLAQAGKLKGQGQISNMEREMLKNAATALDMKLGDPDYLKELAKVEAQFQRMLGGVAAPAGAGNISGGVQEFDYVPGKGLVPRKPK
jgi:hypothetical protein